MAFPRPVRLPMSAAVPAALLGWACAPPAPPGRSAPIGGPPAASCLVTADSAGPPRAVTVMYTDSGEAERARLADSLRPPARLDCTGRPLPALAAAWSSDSSGMYWTLEFGPGAPAAGAVVAAWRASPGATAALEFAAVRSLLPLDDQRLAVGFSSAHRDFPTLFAEPALGAPREPAATTRLLVRPGGDPRDALDRGADVVVGRDPLLLDYARHRPEYSVVPLPWSRSYLLLVPPGRSVGRLLPADTAGFRSGLARDAVHAEARAGVPPYWWESAGCPARPGPTAASSPPPSTVIGYRRDDATARELAERLVALGDTRQLTARGYSPDSLAGALRAGEARAYVVAVPAHPYVPCREMADWPPGSVGIGLVETREHAVIRRGSPPLAVDWDGTLRAAESSGFAPSPP